MQSQYSKNPGLAETDAQHQSLQVINLSKNNIIIAEKVVWAGTGQLRKRGLLGRESIDQTEGIYLIPCEWIHTFGMKFPIDVAFISSRGRVLSVHHGIKPNRLSKLILRAEGVLELASGRLRATSTEVGDMVQFLEIQ